MGLLIEQQLVVLSEAIKHKSFEMDAERIRNLRFADERTGETVWI